MTAVKPQVRESGLDPAIAARLKRDAGRPGLRRRAAAGTGEVLMVAWMDDEALHRTLDHRPGHLLVAQPAGVLGEGRHVRATSSTCARCGWTATATRCWWSSTRTGAACHTGDRTCFDADVLLNTSVKY